MKSLLFLFFALLSLNTYAENRLVYFGGGLSTNPGDEMFDYGLKASMAYANRKKWQSDFYYRKELPKSLSPEAAKTIKSFTPRNFKDKIENLRQQILAGKIKSGDQLLIHLDTHGNINENRDYVISTDQDPVSVKALKGLIEAAEKKNVKLGIIGATCYSGSLLKYKSPNTCIISASQADRIAYGTITDTMITQAYFENGAKNLEELYLLGRKTSGDSGLTGQPMISTDAGIQTDEYLTPFKNGTLASTDVNKETDKPFCRNFALGLEDFQKQFGTLRKVTGEGLTTGDQDKPENKYFYRLKKNLDEYSRLYEKNIQFYTFGKKDICLTNESFSNSCYPIDSWDFYIKDLDQQKKECENFKDNEARNPCLSNLIHKKNALRDLQKNSEFQAYKKMEKQKTTDLETMERLAQKMVRDESELYQLLYEEASQKSTAPNPCRDFKL